MVVHGWEIHGDSFRAAEARLEAHISSGAVRLSNKAISAVPGKLLVNGRGQLAGVFTDWEQHGRTNDAEPRSYVTATTFEEVVLDERIEEVIYARVDVEGYEVRVIEGMRLDRNMLKFPLFQYELGGSWVDSRHASNMSQADFAAYLTHLGYELYLIGEIFFQETPVLLPILPEDFHACAARRTGGCVEEDGRYFIQGNALAVLKDFQKKNSWLASAISSMVSSLYV